jgi:hypothetical protein
MDLVRVTHKKNPVTLPRPNMTAAQAFPSACSARGRISTIRARSTACTDSLVRSPNRNIEIQTCAELTGVDAKVDAVYCEDREPDGQSVVLKLQ